MVDLKNPDLYLDGPPHEVFARLRRECPVYWNAESDGPGFWAITKYHDIAQISRNPALYASARKRGGHRIQNEEDVSSRDAAASMISMDPPEHTHYRRMLSPALSAPKLAGMEPRIRQRVRDILDRVADLDTCEFVSSVAAELPIQVLAELLGVPQEDRCRLFEWSDAVIGEDDPELRASPEHIDRCEAEMAEYALRLRERRRAEPGDDLVSMLAHARVDGRPMSDERFLSAFALMVVAGNETTRNAIAGGVLALTEHPDQRRLLVERPQLIARAVDEIIRWVSPVHHMRRTATGESTIRGERIREGDKIVLWYPSANRDEEVFLDPFRFDVTRAGPPHLAFGIGPHFCLGSRLAELELRVLLEELLPRCPEIDVCGPIARLRSNFINGIKRMPVRLRPTNALAPGASSL